MDAETPAGVFARHVACAAATRAGLQALGFELFADRATRRGPSRRHASRRASTGRRSTRRSSARGLVLAGGQGKLTGQIFRLGHLGSVTLDEIVDAIGASRRSRSSTGRPVEIGGGRRRGPARPAPRSTGGRWHGRRGVRILVAEPIAPEGVELLRAHHEVDDRTGLVPAELRGDPRRLRRARRPQPGRGRRGADRRRAAAPGHRAGGRRRRQRRPRRRHAGRDHRRQRADRQHDRRGRAHDRAALALARRVAAADASHPARRVEARGRFRASQLRGRTLGIVGLGKIGMAIAERARAWR